MAKKIVRLTEIQLNKIIKKIVSEQHPLGLKDPEPKGMGQMDELTLSQFKDKIMNSSSKQAQVKVNQNTNKLIFIIDGKNYGEKLDIRRSPGSY